MDSPEMRDAVVAQDVALEELVDFLNREVGRGGWALVLTADHGSMVPPRVSGGLQIPPSSIVSGINGTFDRDGDGAPVVALLQPTQIFVDTAELRRGGYTLEDVSRWIMGLTYGDVAAPGVPVDPGRADQPVFRAAYPSSIMPMLPCLPEARR
jgi:hypothetical protein